MPNPTSFVETYLPPPPEPEEVKGPEGVGAMQRWLYSLYETTLKDGGSFPKVSVTSPNDGAGSFTNENLFQDLVTLDRGLYSNYFTDKNVIAYGFACNVRRSGGAALTVGAQINAWGDPTGTGKGEGVFGANFVALGPRGHTGALIGIEVSPAEFNDSTVAPKIGVESVFINRQDLGAAVLAGLGANLYNYNSKCFSVSSIPRSSAGEFCGWYTGLQFGPGSLDASNALAWNAVTTYQTGQLVTYLGGYYRAIAPSLNQIPAPVSAFWVFYLNNLAIGVDFSITDIATMARISSAIRLRDTMRIDYDAQGVIGQFYDPFNGRMVLCSNLGLGAPPLDRVLEVDVLTGFLYRFNVFLI